MDGKAKDRTEISQWLGTGGERGNPPLFYFLIRAARYLGVPVWELENREDAAQWVAKALTCDYGENQGARLAQEIAEQRASNKPK